MSIIHKRGAAKGSNMSQESRDLIAYLRANGPSSFEQLHTKLGGRKQSLRGRIANLKVQGYLFRDTADTPVRYCLLADAADLPPAAPVEPKPKGRPSKTAAPAPAPAPAPTAPAQYDMMRAPVWRPPSPQPARAGAQDFLTCKSLQQGHLVAYRSHSGEGAQA